VEIWMGHVAFADAIRDRRVHVDGPAELARSLPTWFKLHLLVEIERTRAASA
jgi:hypothetical protein